MNILPILLQIVNDVASVVTLLLTAIAAVGFVKKRGIISIASIFIAIGIFIILLLFILSIMDIIGGSFIISRFIFADDTNHLSLGKESLFWMLLICGLCLIMIGILLSDGLWKRH